MSGNERYGRCQRTVGQRNARIGRAGDGAGDPRYFLKGHARVEQLFAFFSAASENIGIPSLETRHHFALFGQTHQESVDFRLGEGMIARFLSHIDKLRIRTGVGEQLFAGKKVIDDRICPFKGAQASEGNEAGIAGTRSDQIYVHSASRRTGKFQRIS